MRSEIVDVRPDSIVILANVPTSMDTPVALGRRRIDALRSVLDLVVPSLPYAPGGVQRSRHPALSPARLSQNRTGYVAGSDARDMRSAGPSHVIIISDGEPEDRPAAVSAARALQSKIDA